MLINEQKSCCLILRLLNDELSAKTANATKLEADLISARKSLDSHRDIEKALEAEQQMRVEDLEKRLSGQTDVIANLEFDLLKSEEALAAASNEDESRTNELQTEIDLLVEQLSDEASTSEKCKADLLNAEQELEQQAQRTADEQKRSAELRSKTNELEQKLMTKAVEFSELDSDLLIAKNALSAAQKKNSERENEWQTNIDRLEEDLKSEKAASKKHEAELSEMKEALENQQASESNQLQRTTELQAALTNAEQEVEQLRLELNEEKAAVAESVEKLAASRSKVSRLREERSNAEVNRSNYMKLAKKVVRYKKLYRASEETIKHLTEQNTGLSHLAAEYLEATDGMMEEFSERAKLVTKLKQRMLQSESNKTNAEPNDMVEETSLAEQPSRQNLLTLQADFEASSDNSLLVTSNGQPVVAEPDRHRVNSPR